MDKMDKQIIIDGEKITKEDFIDYFSIELTNRNVDERKEIGNKYFEIILSKEQKCKRLKSDYFTVIQQRNIAERQLDQLKAENKELKNDHLQEVGQLKFAIGTLTAENLHLKELLDMRIEALCDSCKAGSMLPIKCRIYEKILAEIEEIAMGIMDDDLEESSAYYDAKQILQKISECEGNDGL